MYVRTLSRTNKDGSTVTYVQLAHNVRDKDKGYAKAEVLYSFGRLEELDVEAIKRLVRSLCRFLPAEDTLSAQVSVEAGGESMQFLRSVALGGAYVLRALWERLGLHRVLDKGLRRREYRSPVPWAIFAMVANRALAPDSKRAVEEWVKEDVALGNPDPIELQHLYRAMDFLLEHEEEIQKEVFFSTADLLNLEVDLVFFDTTSSYVECDEEDAEGEGIRRYGHSKDKRPDLPQVVIGLAVTKEGIPVRCWVLPGNTQDMTTVQRVKADLAGWRLNRCVWVMDRGMNSQDNRVILQKAGGHYIVGEKLRDAHGVHAEALSRAGRYRKVRDTLEVKEVVVGGDGERRRRFIVVYNPEQAKKDRLTRDRTLKQIEEHLAVLGNTQGKEHSRRVCALLSHRTMGRYLRQLKGGGIRLDKAKVAAEERLDGTYLLSSSDDSLSAQDIALGYKQLIEVERAFRTLKTTLELRPIYHRKEQRIRAHILLCFLALLLVRVIENETGHTWDHVRSVLQRIHLGEFFSKDGRVLQRTELTKEQSNLLKRLRITPPPKLHRIDLDG